MGINPGPRDRSGFLGLLTTPAATSAAQIHTRTHRESFTKLSTFKWLCKGIDCHPSLENKDQRKKKPGISRSLCTEPMERRSECTEPQGYGGSRCGKGPFAQRNNPGQEAVEISPLPSRPTALLTQQEKSGGEERKTPSGKLGHLECIAVMYPHLPLPQNPPGTESIKNNIWG